MDILFTRVSFDAIAPIKRVFFMYFISETGRSLQIVLPPRTARSIRTGIKLENLPLYAAYFTIYAGDAVHPPLIILNPMQALDGNEIILTLYNGGHDSLYLKHGSAFALMQIVPYREDVRLIEASPSKAVL